MALVLTGRVDVILRANEVDLELSVLCEMRES